jgi:GNAT superfamily N-acetyltransferase
MSDEPGGAGIERDGTSEHAGLQRKVLVLRAFTAAHARRLAELDRSESVRMLFAVRDGEIVPLGHGEEVPQWSGAWLDGVVAFARRHLEAGGTGVAAFDGDLIAGVAVVGGAAVRGDPRELQLALLHVGRPHRRRGVAGRLLEEVRQEALRRGARRLYVSATPSEAALGFYLARGARLAVPVDPTLAALEPDDVHLVLEL